MSTDYAAVCFTCRKATHLGQRMGLGYSFGFGSNDVQGRLDVWAWLERHLHPQDENPMNVLGPHDLRIMESEQLPDGFELELEP